ncbi:U3 small nucleolar RNA-associated protein [Umbelopsis sp. WA50703]
MEVHRCRFVEYQPAACNTLDFTPPSVTMPRLACGRANGNIEIWDPSHKFRLEKIIPGGANMSVEALVWAHQTVLTDVEDYDTSEELEAAKKRQLAEKPRLFSSGLNPYIVEWDTVAMCAKRFVDSNGGAIWCLAVNSIGTLLAAGCEDGCVRLFDIADGNLEFIRAFDKQKGRILSIAWGVNDMTIVSGSSDSTIKVWDVKNGKSIQRMTVDRVKKEDTLVWSVAALSNGIVVSGDSLGNVMFWQAESGTLQQSFKGHGADVLSVVASRDGQCVFTAGVDRKIMAFRVVQVTDEKKTKKNNPKDTNQISAAQKRLKWVNAGNRRYHSHDIRALALHGSRAVNTLVSGGVDVQLIAVPAADFPNLIQNKLPPCPQKDLISVSKSRHLLMCTFFNSVTVWRLGKAMSSATETEALSAEPQLVEPQQAVLELKLKDENNLTSGVLSEDGQWIAVSDIDNVKLFRIQEDPQTPGQLKVKKQGRLEHALAAHLKSDESVGAHHLIFSPGSDRLLIATTDSQILVVSLSKWASGEFEVLCQFDEHRDGKNTNARRQIGTVTSMTVSADGQWLVTADHLNRIFVFNMDSLKPHAKLPISKTPYTAISFNPYRPNHLLVALASNEFYIYDVEQKRHTEWSQKNAQKLPKQFLELRDRIMGVAYNPAQPDTIIIYGSTYLCSVDLTRKTGDKNAVLNVNKRKEADRQAELAIQKKREQYKTLGVEQEVERTMVNGKTGQAKVAKAKYGETSFLVSHKYQQILYSGFIDANEMVVVERPKFSMLEKLPPSFYKPHFGT